MIDDIIRMFTMPSDVAFMFGLLVGLMLYPLIEVLGEELRRFR